MGQDATAERPRGMHSARRRVSRRRLRRPAERKLADDDLVLALGGPPADWVRTGEPSGPPYWLRVWAARGLLYAWDDSAVLKALHDDVWRVREMALKVVARHCLQAASEQVDELRSDPSARVRAAASRTSRALGGD